MLKYICVLIKHKFNMYYVRIKSTGTALKCYLILSLPKCSKSYLCLCYTYLDIEFSVLYMFLYVYI